MVALLLVVIGLENSRNDLTCCEVWNQKADHSDHCPTAICLFCFFWVACVVLYNLRLGFTAKDVLLAVLSDYLRWGWSRHYWNYVDVNEVKVLIFQTKDTVGYGFFYPLTAFNLKYQPHQLIREIFIQWLGLFIILISMNSPNWLVLLQPSF